MSKNIARTAGIASALIIVMVTLGSALSHNRKERARKTRRLQVASSPGQTEPVNYKIGRQSSGPTPPNELYLYVSIAPEYFIRGTMAQLARQLNKDFPRDQKIIATIFDDERNAQNGIPAGASFSLFMETERGQYYLDRVKGYEYIAFSTKRGRPASETILNLGRACPKWLRKRKHVCIHTSHSL